MWQLVARFVLAIEFPCTAQARCNPKHAVFIQSLIDKVGNPEEFQLLIQLYLNTVDVIDPVFAYSSLQIISDLFTDCLASINITTKTRGKSLK